MIRFDEPTNQCFGCSHTNPRGLVLELRAAGASAVEGRYTADDDLCGAPGVIHGGIQAALLDEAMGFAIHAHRNPDVTVRRWNDGRRSVTADFALRYRRPALTGQPLTVRARVVGEDGRDVHCEAQLVGADGVVVTSATARWVTLEEPAG